MAKYTKEQLTQDFIERARKAHGDKFDYSKVDYTCKDSIVTIICPEHGEFRMMAHTHVRSPHGCQKCAEEARRKKRSLGKEDFIKKAMEIHGDKYDYSKVEYVNNSTNVVIVCPEHGEFLQAPSNHLSGKGCPLCGNKKRSQSNTKTTESFIASAIKKHGYRYDYSKVHYVNEKTVC